MHAPTPPPQHVQQPPRAVSPDQQEAGPEAEQRPDVEPGELVVAEERHQRDHGHQAK